jgi:predicted ATPase
VGLGDLHLTAAIALEGCLSALEIDHMAASTLDHITIRGFKSIAAVEKLPLRPVNILIGSNGSGKSNFIGFFAFLHAIRQGQLRSFVTAIGGAEKLLHFGSKTTNEIYTLLSFLDEVNQYELTLSPTQDDGLYPTSENVFFWNKSVYPRPYRESLAPRVEGREAGISDQTIQGTASWVRARLGGWRLYHVHDTSSTSPMRKTAKVHNNDFLQSNG